MGFFKRIRPDPGLVSPIRSDPIRSDPDFVNGLFQGLNILYCGILLFRLFKCPEVQRAYFKNVSHPLVSWHEKRTKHQLTYTRTWNLNKFWIVK